MKKMIIAAAVLLVVQLGLTMAFYMGNKGVGEAAPDALFLTFSPDAVQSLQLTDGEGKSVVLDKNKDGWTVPAHFSAPVDQNKVKALLDKLAEMKQGFVVATSAEAAKRFKVDKESFENHVVLKGAQKTLADFYVGTSPAFRQVHARRGENDQIVTIPLSSFELESSTDKWLDTSLATIKDADLTGLTIGDIKLNKTKDGWQLEGLKEGEKLNKEEVDALVTKARGLSVQDVLDPAQVSALFAQPAFRFNTVRKDGKAVEYLFAKGKDDFYVLKISDRNLYLKVHSLPVDALQKVTRDKLVEVAKVPEKSSEAVENK